MEQTVTPAAIALVPPKPRPVIRLAARFRRELDLALQGLSFGGALGMILLLVALAAVLVVGSWPAIKAFGIQFFIGDDWDPVRNQYGALPFIFGTVISSLVALVIAVPMSIGCALFLTRMAPGWIAAPVSFLIELLAAVPSIVYGFWGLATLLPFLNNSDYGFKLLRDTIGQVPLIGKLFSGPAFGGSLLASGIVLAIMVIPIITAVTRDVLVTVPREIEEGAYALGATWWQACLAILNFGKLGILGAVILGFARAIGETMAVTMVIGNTNAVPKTASLFNAGATMSSLLANEFQNADTALYQHALVYIALVLLLMTVATNFVARVLVLRVKSGLEGKPSKAATAERNEVEGESAATLERIATKQPWTIKIAPVNYTVRKINVVFKSLCIFAAGVAIALLFMIFGYVLFKGFSSLSWDFFTKNPGASTDAFDQPNPIGMKNQIIGSVELIALASLIGVPFGMLVGIYLSEYAKKNMFSNVVRLVVDVLAGTPSIIVGVLAYTLIIAKGANFPSLGWGNCGWGGAMALAFIMIPIVARTTEEMLRLVPESLREASLALGGAKYQTILSVVVPAAKSGIITGVMLSIARVAGETAPLIFTALGSNQDVYDPSKPFPALTLKIYEYAQSADSKWVEQAWAGMLVLIVMIAILSALVRYVTRSRKAGH